jgi:hypothetical protein
MQKLRPERLDIQNVAAGHLILGPLSRLLSMQIEIENSEERIRFLASC